MSGKRRKTNMPTIIAVCSLAVVLFASVPFVGDWIINTYINQPQGETAGTEATTLPTDGDTIAPVAQGTQVVLSAPTVLQPEDFISDIQDSSPVTASFVAEPNWSLEGAQDVYILLTDAYGNSTTIQSALVLDTQAPKISGASNLEVYIGNSVSYRNGITVYDSIDSDPVLSVDSSSVDLSTPGTYSLTYTATDFAGNQSAITVTVTVLEKPDGYVDPEVIYQRVDAILAQFIREDMTDREKVEAVYVWTRRDVHLTYGSAPDRDDYLQTAYEFLDVRKGDCFYFFAIQKLMLERLGIPTIDLKKVKASEEDSNHYWLLVSVDGGESYYHFDNVWSKNLCLVTDAELDTFSSWVDSNPFNRDKSLYPATPTEKLPEGALPWDDPSILAATP